MSCNQYGSKGNLFTAGIFTALPHMCRLKNHSTCTWTLLYTHIHTQTCTHTDIILHYCTVFITYRKITEVKEGKTIVKREMKAKQWAWWWGRVLREKRKEKGRERKREWSLEWLNNGFLFLFSFLEGSEKHRKQEALRTTSLFLFLSV